MADFDDDFDGLYSPFENAHAECICDIRRALERKSYDEARALLDRFFDDNGAPK